MIRRLTTKCTEDTKGITEDQILELCDRVRQIAFELHTYLRHGHFEKVYENGLAHRLRDANIKALQQYPLTVRDQDGSVLGEYIADLFVEDSLIIELKACKTLADEHTAQILGYMRASNIHHALLINFGSPKIQIRKFIQ